MKRTLYLGVLWVALVASLNSCQTDDTNDLIPWTYSKYWNASTLTKMQLRGAVKKLSTGGIDYYFNNEGNLVLKVNTQSFYMDSVHYTYQNKRLTKEIIIYSWMTGPTELMQDSDVIEYENRNIGKYIPKQFENNVSVSGLVPDLSAVKVNGIYAEQYVFNGSELSVIFPNTNGKFTMKYEYEGNYPVSLKNDQGGTSVEIEYASNGMFKAYKGTNYCITYIPDNTYMLINKYESTVKPAQYSKLVRQYIYNNNNDIVSRKDVVWRDPANIYFSSGEGGWSIQSSWTWTDYKYDNHENWISRKNKDGKTETRVIEYY